MSDRLCVRDCPCQHCQTVRFCWMVRGWCEWPGLCGPERWADLVKAR